MGFTKYKNQIELLIVLAIYLAINWHFDIGCPILLLTGIPCMGCGMTRAALSILKLDFKGAFYYHPLIYAMPVLLPVLLLKNKKMFDVFIGIIIALFVLVYFVRLFDPGNALIKINISDGYIYKLIIYLKNRGIIL